MENMIKNTELVGDLVIHQLKAYWLDINEEPIRAGIPQALKMMDDNFKDIRGGRFADGNGGIFNPYFSIHWMIFLYRLAHILYQNSVCGGGVADQVYYLNKIMHSVDWYYAIDLPAHFLCEHPLGSVLGRASYGDWLLVYQGTTIGGSVKDGVLYYPTLGDNIVLFSNASVIGSSLVGSNVIISSGTRVVNTNIPSNCIVYGESPNLVIKQYDLTKMKNMIERYWR